MKRRWHIATLLLIMTVALSMRLYHLRELPPGLFHDEAYNTLDAQALAEGLPHPRFYDSWEIYAHTIHSSWPPRTTRFPVFLEGNYGREALYQYFGALAGKLFGPRVWSLRLVSALAGVLGIFGTYLVTRELYADRTGRGERLGLLAAAVATGIYSLLSFSRLGLRIITLVTLETLTIAVWLRAGRTRKWRWWALAGLLLGLSQYTYIPARALPLIVAFPTTVWYVHQKQQRSQLLRKCAFALAITLIVTLPLILFFVRYPAYLTLRAQDIAAQSAQHGIQPVLANVGRVVWGVFVHGDRNPILNLPGRPLLDAVQSVLLLIGLAAILRPVVQPASLLLLFWAAAMFAPSVVSGIAPSFGRSIGAVAPMAIIVAMGIDTAWSKVIKRWPHLQVVFATLVVGILCFSVGLTAQDYFVSWAAWPDLDKTFHQDVATVGHYIATLPYDATVYITPTQTNSASLLLAIGEREPPDDFYGPAGLLPAGAPKHETWYIVLTDDHKTPALLAANLPGGTWVTETSLFRAYRVPASANYSCAQGSADGDFGNLIRLCEHREDSLSYGPGDTLEVHLTWQALAEMDQRFTAFVHLLGPLNPATGSPLWAQDDHEPGDGTYATDRWFQDELVIDTFYLHVPADAPAGEYKLTTGFYNRESMERLQRSDEASDTIELLTIDLVE